MYIWRFANQKRDMTGIWLVIYQETCDQTFGCDLIWNWLVVWHIWSYLLLSIREMRLWSWQASIFQGGSNHQVSNLEFSSVVRDFSRIVDPEIRRHKCGVFFVNYPTIDCELYESYMRVIWELYKGSWWIINIVNQSGCYEFHISQSAIQRANEC